jgi:hypothetical protein
VFGTGEIAGDELDEAMGLDAKGLEIDIACGVQWRLCSAYSISVTMNIST